MLSNVIATFQPMPLVAATLANMLLGMLWYSPVLFGNIWMKLTGMRPSDANMHAGHLLAATLVAFSTALGLKFFIHTLGIRSYVQAIEMATILWTTMVASSHFNKVIWENKSINLYALDASYFLVSMTIMSCILVAL